MDDRRQDLQSQQALLEQVTATYRRGSPQDDVMRKLCIRAIEPWLQNTHNGLEIGCSDGQMTEMLSKRLDRLTVVEATDYFLDEVRRRDLQNVALHHSMIERFSTDERFDCIFLTWILTHLVDVQAVLHRVHALLSEGGLLFVMVPNVRVLSRQLALHMELIDDLYALTENDKNHGHVHAYDRQRLNRELEQAGFQCIDQGGLMLKMLADYQMDELYKTGMLGDKHIEGLYQLGRIYPDLSSAIYSVCRVKA